MAAATIPYQFTGSRGWLGLATETTFSVYVTPSDYVEMDDGEAIELEPGNTAIKTIRASRASVSHFIQTGTWVEGSWPQAFYPNQGIRALAVALGSDQITAFSLVETAGTTGGTFTVTIGADTTPNLAWNISNANLASAICNLADVGTTNVNVTGTPGSAYTVALNTTIFSLANPIGAIGVSGANLTGTGHGISVQGVTHVLTCREDGLPSISIEKGMSGQVNPNGSPATLGSMQYAGCLIDKVVVTGAVDAAIKVVYTLMGMTEAQTASPSSPSWMSETPYALGATGLTIFGVSTSATFICTAFEFTLTNGVQKEIGYQGLTVRTPALIYAAERMIEGKVTVVLNDPNYVLYNDSVAGTLGDIVIIMSNSSLQSATITLKNVELGKIGKPLKIGKSIYLDVPFTGSLQIGAAADITATILNGKTSIYC